MNPHADPFQELADLFLTEPDAPAPTEGDGAADAAGGPDDTAVRTADAELVVVGSLPVRATLWLVPYADAVGRQVGPTALVRLDDETATLQVLQAGQGLPRQPWPTLAEAIAALAGYVARWVIRPPLNASPAELAAADCRRVTILSSANDGAIVDAYQRIKALVETAEATGADRPALGLAVLGAEPPRAQRMQRQLSRTTRTFLDVELPLVACVQRMDAAIRAAECLTFSDEPKPALPTVLRWLRDACGAAERVVPPPEAPAVTVPAADRVAPPPEAPAVTALAADRHDAVDEPRAAPAPSSAVRIAPKPGASVEPKEPALAVEPDTDGAPVSLASFIDGVTPLDVRCPGHERLELGIDAAGRLHVIARERQLRELHAVEAWARAHRELLGRACPDHWIDPAAGTVCHVFTDQPATVADLHGSALRLHVLAPVFVEGKQGWYAAPLS